VSLKELLNSIKFSYRHIILLHYMQEKMEKKDKEKWNIKKTNRDI
jgi:hypothetical protein